MERYHTSIFYEKILHNLTLSPIGSGSCSTTTDGTYHRISFFRATFVAVVFPVTGLISLSGKLDLP
jgi:hypothetical protein